MRIFNTLAFIFFTCLLSFQALAQPKVTSRNDPNGTDEPKCTKYFQIEIMLANLGEAPNDAIFPASLPPMNLEAEFGGQIVVRKLIDFDYAGVFNGVDMWKVVVDISFDFCELCAEEGQQVIKRFMNLKLTSPGLGLYPACDYYAPEKIFDCRYFNPTNCTVGGAVNCDVIELTTSSTLIAIDCRNLGYVVEENLTDNETETSSREFIQELEIWPNPTSEGINVRIGNKDESIHNLSVYNLHGKKVFAESQIGTNELFIDISNNSSGLYILRLQTNERNYTRRVYLE